MHRLRLRSHSNEPEIHLPQRNILMATAKPLVVVSVLLLLQAWRQCPLHVCKSPLATIARWLWLLYGHWTAFITFTPYATDADNHTNVTDPVNETTGSFHNSISRRNLQGSAYIPSGYALKFTSVLCYASLLKKMHVCLVIMLENSPNSYAQIALPRLYKLLGAAAHGETVRKLKG